MKPRLNPFGIHRGLAQPSTPEDRERLVLTFHGIGDPPAHVGKDERPYWCPESAFTSILDHVGEVQNDAGLPIQITLDDGNDTDARLALPALVERGLTAHFFICAGRIGGAGYLDKAQVRQLRDAGMEIGSHGWGHVDWRRVDDAGMDQELRVAREWLSEIAGKDVTDVAIPFGSYDRRVMGMLRHSRVHAVYTSDGGRASARGWMISRQTCTATWDAMTLWRIACTPPPPRERIRRAVVCLVKRYR
jgi:peptidoglycan/xylan/chitin deacetylase (PgdA/CDA1 family)